MLKLHSSASRQLSTFGPSSRLVSQRLRSKALFRFTQLAFSLTRRPTLGHSSAVRLRLLRMDKLLRIVIPRHLSEGFKE
jgi:hypothetical protein